MKAGAQRLPPKRARRRRRRGGASAGLADAEAAHLAARNAARAALDALSEAREIRGRDEERVIAAGSRKTELAAQAAEHFGRPVEELRALAELAPDAALPEAEATEARLHKLKAERERLGGVNLRAEEEANELETRLDEMRAEHGDLEEAIKRLRQGIQSLNREGRERLLAAFDTVNGAFLQPLPAPLRRRHRRACADRLRRSARSGAGDRRASAGQDARRP